MNFRGILRLFPILFVLYVIAPFASAQTAEVGLLFGRLKPSDRSITTGGATDVAFDGTTTYQVNFASKLVNGQVASLQWELIFAGAPSADLTTSNAILPKTYKALFITPGVRFRLIPGSALSPYIATGVGYARLTAGNLQQNGAPYTGDKIANNFVWNFGGGLDYRIIGPVTLRGEVRDFVVGTPRFNVNFVDNKQHNLFVAAGVVLKF